MDSNGPYFQAALRQLGIDAAYLGVVQDVQGRFEEVIEKALATGSYDAFNTTGAVSVRKFDFIRQGLTDFEAKTRFRKVAIRPRHPVLFAVLSPHGQDVKNSMASTPMKTERWDRKAARRTPSFACQGIA